MLVAVKSLIRKVVFRFIKPTQYVSNTYSQAGEDAIINFLVNDKKLSQLTYLDVGTNNPDWGNNTYLFYRKGFRGVCVEADKTFVKKIQQVRPEDKVLNVGVNIGQSEFATFYIFDEPSLSTFDKAEAEFRQAKGNYKIAREETVQLQTIEKIISDNFQKYPDILSIDIEGLDLVVLQSLDFNKYPIPIICTETCTYSENHVRPKDPAIAEFMLKNGYFNYADTYINTIFVRTNWFYGNPT